MTWQDFYQWYIESGPRHPDATVDEHLMRMRHSLWEIAWLFEDTLTPVIRDATVAMRALALRMTPEDSP